MYKFYLPFYYLFYSRLKTKIDQISWFIIFIIPPFFISIYFSNLNLVFFSILFFIIELIFNTLYEVGYLENDISTTKNEKEPTMRLDKDSFNFVSLHYRAIVVSKYIITFFGIVFLYIMNQKYSLDLNINGFVLLLIINRIFFYWHNSVRNRWNLLTFAVLAITKYTFPMVLFVDENLLLVSILSLGLFPIIRIIEHSTHKRYGFKNYAMLVGNHDRFRVIYYILYLLFIAVLYMSGSVEKTVLYPFILLGLYFFLYRLASWLFVTKGLYKRDNLKNKDLYIKKEEK